MWQSTCEMAELSLPAGPQTQSTAMTLFVPRLFVPLVSISRSERHRSALMQPLMSSAEVQSFLDLENRCLIRMCRTRCSRSSTTLQSKVLAMCCPSILRCYSMLIIFFALTSSAAGLIPPDVKLRGTSPRRIHTSAEGCDLSSSTSNHIRPSHGLLLACNTPPTFLLTRHGFALPSATIMTKEFGDDKTSATTNESVQAKSALFNQHAELEHACNGSTVPQKKPNRWYHVWSLAFLIYVLFVTAVVYFGLYEPFLPYICRWKAFCNRNIGNSVLRFIAKLPVEQGFWQSGLMQILPSMVDKALARYRGAPSWDESRQQQKHGGEVDDEEKQRGKQVTPRAVSEKE